MTKKYLITSALPYVNNDLSLGILIGCLLPSDVYARFCRMAGRDVLFICGDDMHGTPSEVGAKQAGISVEEYTDRYHQSHLQSVRDFNLSFDIYGTTHTKQSEAIIHDVFSKLDKNGFIEEKIMTQPFSLDDNMFLSDRQIEGTCPKCGYAHARGDECPKCLALLEPRDLINPYSAISGGKNIKWRDTKHLFYMASKTTSLLRSWIDSRIGWPKTATSIANKWMDEGLQDRAITRDLRWGISINKPGYENKVFYVWFDAPWGYVSMSQIARPNDWSDWWKGGENCHYTQFMGKDNVAFHSIFFPGQELATGDNWKTVDVLKAMNFLNFEGAKISKRTSNGIFMPDAVKDAPADCWRYALIASAPETDDTDFTIRRFADIVNKDLNGMLGNFVSRVCKLAEKNFGSRVPSAKQGGFGIDSRINEKLEELTDALDACEFRPAIAALRGLWAIGNEFMTETEPWTLVKNGNTDVAGAVLNECFQLIDLYARVSAPFIPDAAENIQNIFAGRHDLSWPTEYERRIAYGEEFSVPENLFERIDDARVAELTDKYSKKPVAPPKIVVAKILEVAAHPTKEGLSILTIDAGETKPLQIVCGAPNVRAGLIGVLAKIGAVLPGQKKPITLRAVQNVESFGMMLSAAEIGEGSDCDNILELPQDFAIGKEFEIR
ncbi:MAG: methionine--tRNA ligase [Rickettsiales bacterium]|jgi:methionyl-tRNA synthetase|nr:methionine--tRNA ligase [Rickettsiales bacterium]